MGPDSAEFGRLGQVVVNAPGVVALRAAVMDVLSAMGIGRAWFLAPLTGDKRVGRILTNIGFSPVWERHYRSYLHLLDPLPDIALRQTGAFIWPDILTTEKVRAKQRRYLKIVAGYGLGSGIGTACYGPHGRSGFLGAELPSDGETGEVMRMRFNAIGQLSFQRYCAIVKRDDEIPALSNRELEVLQWIGLGKSNSVIADLLGISSSSVDVYVRRIFSKLGVADRTSASIKAFMLGLIVTQDNQDLMRLASTGQLTAFRRDM